jgi:ankyrin repeat protein
MNNLFQDETTQAYLNTIREVCFANAFHDITSACIAYLSLAAFAGEISEDALMNIDSRLHFTRHAAKNLGDYARRTEEDENTSAAILEFFQRPDRVAWAYYLHRRGRHRNTTYITEWNKQCFEKVQGLHLATVFGLLNIIDRLLQLGHDINSPNKHGRTALFNALDHGNTDTLRFLLKKNGLDVNARDRNGLTVLLDVKSHRDRQECIKLILEHPNLDVNARDKHGRTALMCAISNAKEETAELLLARSDVDITPKDAEGHTALSRAVLRGYRGIVKSLLETSKVDLRTRYDYHRYVDVGMGNCTLLHLALGRPMYRKITTGHEAILEMLLATKAIDVNARDASGATVLHRSTKYRQTKALEILLDQGDIDFNAEDEKGQTPLHWTAFSNSNAIQILLKQKGVNVNAKTKTGSTMLHLLSEGTGIDADLLLKRIQMLIEIDGVDLNLRDKNGQTPLGILKNKTSKYPRVGKMEKEKMDLLEARGGVV